jgi:hypothetical protein
VEPPYSGRKIQPEPAFGILQGSLDVFDDCDGLDLPATKAGFCKRFPIESENTLHAIIDGLYDLVREIKGSLDEMDYNPQKLWFHQLCRRVQRFVPTSLECGATFAPFGLLWVEFLREYKLLAESEFQHWVQDDVRYLFEEEWEKVLIPEGLNFVGVAVSNARESTKRFADGSYGFFLNVAYQLHLLRGSKGFAIPTSEPTAELLGVSGRTVSLYLSKGEKEGFLKCINKSYRPGSHARTYKFVERPND